MRIDKTLAFLITFVIGGAGTAAGLPKSDRKAAKSLLEGTLYARIDMPCKMGRHPFGVYKSPMVELTATDSKTERASGLEGSGFHLQGACALVRPNDSLKLDEMSYGDDGIEIELEGVGRSEGRDTVIKLVNIATLDDFTKAIDSAFAHDSLESEHPEWPEEVRKAIADRVLLTGMTKRQAFYVVGQPTRMETIKEGVDEVEIWYPRQDNGICVGFFTGSAGEQTGWPEKLRFKDAKLTETPKTGPVQLD